MRVKKGKPEKQLGQIILAVRMSVWLVLKWSPISFGPLTFLGPEKFGPYNDFHAGTKFLVHTEQFLVEMFHNHAFKECISVENLKLWQLILTKTLF